jgi:DNA-binding MarR family transcriptional regulator
MSEPEFRERREQMLLRLLLRMTQSMTNETVARMNARGIVGMQPAYPRLLGNLDTDGTRLSALARRMGVTRQATAQLVTEIEKNGFVARRPDPDDGRGIIVLFTEKGRHALATAVDVMTGIEADYVKVIGGEGMANIKRMLKAILDRADKPGEFGMD